MTPPTGGLTSGSPFEPTDPTRPLRDLYRVQGRSSPRSPRIGPFIPGSYIGGYAVDAAPTAPPPSFTSTPAVATGLLRLSITPADAEIFVDSFFVGTGSDIEARRGLTLEAGPHRIELRAADHETHTFDIRIPAYDVVTYRGVLEPLRPAAGPVRPPAASSAPMYMIPNCYLGNIPPRASRLPKGCDIKQVQILGSR